jgi:hypothetical protein
MLSPFSMLEQVGQDASNAVLKSSSRAPFLPSNFSIIFNVVLISLPFIH